MRSNVRIIQTALDRPPQERAAGLIDATDYDRYTLQRCRDGRWVGNIDPASANAVANCRRDLIRPRQITASDHDAAWIIGREFGRDTSPDDAVATDEDQHSLEFTQRPQFSFNMRAFTAQITVLADIRAAPTAGPRTMPHWANCRPPPEWRRRYTLWPRSIFWTILR